MDELGMEKNFYIVSDIKVLLLMLEENMENSWKYMWKTA